MPFSKLFAALVLVGIVPIVLATWIGGAVYVWISYNTILFTLLVLDFVLSPGAKDLEVQRVCDEKFSLGAENRVGIRIRNNSRYTLKIEFSDEVPDYMLVQNKQEYIRALPHGESEGDYWVIPEKRGEFVFGKVHLRFNGILKLCSKTIRYDVARSYKVYPNLRDLRKYSLAAIKKTQLMQGTKKTRSYGIGTEFESLREYSLGDDYRKVNWMATARANKLIVNNYQTERNQQVFILLDSSRVMNSEINYIKKLDYAINSSFLLAEIATKKGDHTGLLVFDHEVRRFVKPGKGNAHFQLIAENLYNVEENMVTADYQRALMYLQSQRMRRSLLCIFTELFNVDEALYLVASLKKVARNHIPLIITIKDMRPYELVNGGISTVEDLYLKSAAIKMVEEREKIQKIFFESGIPCLDVPPDKLSIELLNKYLTMKSMMQI